MKNITVSAIVPTHNRAELLRKAIDSIIGQTYPVDEIVVVDDSNCYKTKELVEGYQNSNIKLVHNPEQGASSSRNLGVQKASCDFIAFLDDDDIWLPEKIEKQVELVKMTGASVAFSQLFIQYENSTLNYATKTKYHKDISKEILMENALGATITSFIKRSAFLEIQGFDVDFPAREEYDLWIRLIHSGNKICVVEEPLAISYRSLENRARISQNIDSYIRAIDLLNSKHQGLVCSHLDSNEKKLRKSKQYDFLGAQAISIGLQKESAKWYFKSLGNKFSLKSFICLTASLISPRLLIFIRSKV